MIRRLSIVNHIQLRDLSFSTVFQIGDTKELNAHDRALAVQRNSSTFYRSEGNFSDYPIFRTPIELPVISKLPQTIFNHQRPTIKVNRINITGISSSSILHIGAINHVCLESRVKHIRHFTPTDGGRTNI